MSKGAIKVDKKYTHFALRKSDNKIVNGWDYKNSDSDDIKLYSSIDLKDNDLNPKDYKVLSSKSLLKLNINPFEWENWAKYI